MKKNIFLMVAIAVVSLAFTGCSKKAEEAKVVAEVKEADVVTTASIVDNGEALLKAVSADGAWLAATLNDVVVNETLVVEGEFTNRDVVDRKLALYTQDENRVITEQYTVTAPKMIVKSPNFRITGGTFKGDIYVEADGFSLDKSSTVEGDIYFSTQAQLDAFTMDETAKLVGNKSVK
ncbi:hypothetical protein EW093_01960 [Thiospirochaeta perfilievii]|uniref:Polymer-forming cytoskeletal protein n=1 Tax=Thiospirochaeta perfilievii TaxID=252967 RepID=A0A5C1QA38_9SPIO|nr:hypothetical protein [Thiospirochaeta perfilievii]QEN03514.1 hypothetical protein EW093_01960 [Thiospirochaeta perfilievii]